MIKTTGKSLAEGNAKDVEIAVPLKYLRNFWRTPEMSLTNCEINLILTWSEDCCFFCNWRKKFKVTDTKLYVPVLTSSIQDKAKLPKREIKGYNVITDGENLISRLKMILEHMIILEKFQQIKEMIILLAACQITIISKNIIK